MNMPNNIPVPKDTNINTDKVKDKGKDKDVKKNGKNLSIVI